MLVFQGSCFPNWMCRTLLGNSKRHILKNMFHGQIMFAEKCTIYPWTLKIHINNQGSDKS